MKKRYFWKTKDGEKISFKDFIKKWKSGIENITPIQKIKTQILGTRIMVIGLVLGLAISIYGWKNLWWVGIILIGALINTGVQYLGLRQQRKLLDNLEKQFNLEDMQKEILGKGEEEMVLVDGKEKEKVVKEVSDVKELCKAVKELPKGSTIILDENKNIKEKEKGGEEKNG